MGLAGPRLCCFLGVLLFGCFAGSTSAEPSASSIQQASAAGAAAATAAQTRPKWVAAVLGGNAAERNREPKKAAADSNDSYEDDFEDAASLKSMFGLGPKDLPDYVDPTLIATGMDTSADSSSTDSSVGVAIVDAKRNRKAHALAHSIKRRYSDVDSAEADPYADADSAHSSSGSSSEEELLQAFEDAEQEESQQKQHHKQHHKQKGLAWVLGRRSAKQAGKDGLKSKEGANGASVGVAFVENRVKPLLAAIKSKAPHLGRGGNKNRKYTRAEVEEIVKIMSAESKAKQGQQGAEADFDAAAASTSGSDNSVLGDPISSSSSSSEIYAQDSGDAYDDAYAEARFKDLVKELRHHKKAPTAAADAADAADAAGAVAADNPYAYSAHKHAPNTDALIGSDSIFTDSALGAGSADPGLPGAADSAVLAGSDKVHQHKGAKKASHSLSAAYSDAKKQLKARKAGHAAHMAGLASSKDSLAAAKAKHKKPHSTAAATAAAKRAAHKASHTKRQQFLDSQEMEDIKTILEAIYDKENTGVAGDVTGEEAATLAEIQSALQPHIITDDPAAFSLTFNAEDSTASDSIPSEQPAARQEPAPTPAEQPQKPAAAPVASAPKAASENKKAPAVAAGPAPNKPAPKAAAPAAAAKDSSAEGLETAAAAAADLDADEDTEVVYVEEEIEYVETEDADEAEAEIASVDDSDVEIEYIEVDADSDTEASETEAEVEGSGDADESEAEETSAVLKPAKADKTPTEKDDTKVEKRSASDDGAKQEPAVKQPTSSSSSSSSSSNKAEKDSSKAQTNNDDDADKSDFKQSADQPETKQSTANSQAPHISKVPAAASPNSKANSAPSSSGGSKTGGKAEEQEQGEEEEGQAEAKSDSKAQSKDSSRQAAKPAPPAAASGKQAAAQPTGPANPTAPAAADQEGKGEQEEGADNKDAPGSKADPTNTDAAKSAAEGADSCTGNTDTAISNCAACVLPQQGARQECQYCRPGYFRESPLKCTMCPKGAWCAGGKVIYCKEGITTAEPGRWHEHQCNLCAAGFGATSAPGSALSCNRCTVGSYAPQDSILPCQHCPPLTMSIDLVSTGKFGDAGSACLACPAGLVPDETNTDCRCPASNRACACPKGWVSIAGNGSPPCVKCGAGNTYAAVKKDTGVKACVACPRNSVATDGLGCVCKPGFVSSDGTPFVEGGCAACPAGSTSAIKGSSSCSKCAPNTLANADRTECVQQQ